MSVSCCRPIVGWMVVKARCGGMSEELRAAARRNYEIAYEELNAAFAGSGLERQATFTISTGFRVVRRRS